MNKLIRSAASIFIAAYLVSCSAGSTDAEHLAKAEQFLGSGKTKAALIELKNALKKNKDNAKARFLLGKLNLEQGDPAGAEKELRIARKLGIPDESITPLLAEALLQQGKVDEVLELDATTLSAEARARTLAAQGVAKLYQGKKEDAEKLINQALEEYPASPQAQTAQARLLAAKGDSDAAVQILKKALAKNPGYADAWNLLGTIEQSRNNHEAAVKAFSKAIEARENNLGDRLSRAMSLIQLKKFDEAQKDLDKLKRIIPQNTGVNYAQGLVYFSEEKLGDAQAAFEQAATSNNVNPLAFYFLGTINFVKGNLEQAESYSEQFLARAPGNVAGRKLAARIKLKLNKPEAVVELLQPVVKQFDTDVEAMNLLASALLKTGKTDEAIELLNKVATLEPDSAQAQMRLGAGLLMEGEQKKAAEYLEKAAKLDPENRQADILLVLNHMKQRDFDTALKVAQDFQKKNPDSPTPWNLIGRVHLAAGNEAAAIEAFEQALKVSPGDPYALSTLAQLALKKKDYAGARQFYNRILAKHENHLATLIRLSVLDALEKNEEQMVQHLQQAMEAHPEAAQPRLILARYYLTKGDPGKAVTLLAPLDEKQKQTAPALKVMGMAQLQQKKYAEAKVTLEQLVTKAPKSAEAHYLLAQAYGGLNKAAQVEKELGKALELNPDYFQARLAHTRLLIQQKKIDEARKEFQKLKAAYPDNPDVMKLDAAFALADGDSQRALSIYEELLKKAPSTQNMLTLSVMKWRSGDKEGAIALQESWVESHPKDKGALLALANSYLQEKRIDEVISIYEKVLQLDPNNIVALNNLAWYLNERDPKKALAYAEKAHELAPKAPSILDTYAMALLANGDNTKALRMIERALDKAPKNPSMRLHYARIAAANGDRAGAIQALKSLLEEGGDFAEKAEAEALLQELQGS